MSATGDLAARRSAAARKAAETKRRNKAELDTFGGSSDEALRQSPRFRGNATPKAMPCPDDVDPDEYARAVATLIEARNTGRCW